MADETKLFRDKLHELTQLSSDNGDRLSVGMIRDAFGDLSLDDEKMQSLSREPLLVFLTPQLLQMFDKAVNEDNSANRTEKPAEPGLLRQALDWIGIRDPEAPPTKRFVCRVIAAPGDTVEITGERGLQVNGNTLIETAVTSQTRPYDGYLEYPVVLGEGEYFVLSDSRNGGVDSRCFGPVTQDEIQGVVITLLRRNGL